MTKRANLMQKSMSYGYASVLEREETASVLLERAGLEKNRICEYWKNMRRYYDGEHDIRRTSLDFAKVQGLPFTAAQSTDGYIHVETQIHPDIPSFEFNPRDKTDADKAKQREKIVKYVLDCNDLEVKNSRNERTLNILGTSVWKVCWDGDIRFGEKKGDVVIDNPSPFDIFPDPTASDVDSCEYIGYVYKMHKNKARRVFENDFATRGTGFEEYLSSDSFNVYATMMQGDTNCEDDTVTITEWWFRQPCGGKTAVKIKTADGYKHINYEWEAGDIGLCVFINGKEVRYIPKYWKNTDFKSFPFVIYSKIPSQNGIWGKSELEQIIPLIDAKDRELAFAQLNSAYSSNDIIIAEENALAEGENLDNSPGAIWRLRPGMMGKVSRLGNMASSAVSLYTNSSFWQSLIENTTGNFEVSQGKEPSNVTTATGIALLNERAEGRKNLKNIDRSAGFKRLFLLIDKTCLEHYKDGRIVRMGLGAEDDFVYNFGGFVKKTRQNSYIPELDVTIHTGSAVSNSKAFTVSALGDLINMNINSDNYKLVTAYIESTGIPERDAICNFINERFSDKQNDQTITDDFLQDIIKSITNDNEKENDYDTAND